MKRAEKAAKIGKILDELYPQPPIPLEPHRSVHAAGRGGALRADDGRAGEQGHAGALRARADAARRWRRLSESGDPRRSSASCGLAPSKARNIRKRLAQTLVDEHGGQVPHDIEALEKLPGRRPQDRQRRHDRRRSASRPSRSTRTSTASPHAGDCRRARTSSRPSAI